MLGKRKTSSNPLPFCTFASNMLIQTRDHHADVNKESKYSPIHAATPSTNPNTTINKHKTKHYTSKQLKKI